MHQLRHWFGTHTYRASLDLRMTQELLGHSSPNTTTIYAAWSPGAAVPIVQGLSAGGAPVRRNMSNVPTPSGAVAPCGA